MYTYPKLDNLSMANIKKFDDTVTIYEKIDGSQFKFGRVDQDYLYFASKGTKLHYAKEEELQEQLQAGTLPTNMFTPAIIYLLGKSRYIFDGFIYIAEFMKGRRQNKLTYDRAPLNGLVLHDIWSFYFPVDVGYFVPTSLVKDKAVEFQIEPPHELYHGEMFPNFESLDTILQRPSVLGGNMEGIVIKQRGLCGPTIGAKYVSPDFREVKVVKVRSMDHDIESIIDTYRTEPRWEKAIQHLHEAEQLTGTPRDIGPLIKEIKNDIALEEKEVIKELLWNRFQKQILEGAIAGFPDFYKKTLLEREF